MQMIFAALAVLGLSAGAQAQQLLYKAQGNLLPITGLAEDGFGGAYLEVFGAPGYQTYILPAVAAGQPFEAVAARSASLMAPFLSSFTQATATFRYDPAALPNQTTISGVNRYDIPAFDVTFGDGVATTYTLSADMARATVRDGGTSRFFGIDRSYSSFPPPPMAGGPVLTDSTPQSFVVDLNPLIASDLCQCRTPLDLTGVGPLPVLLQGPGSYEARFMFLRYFGSRQTSDPIDATLPNPPGPAVYNLQQTLTVAFDGDFSWTVRAEDYATPEAFDAAQTWIGANVLRINFEQTAVWQINSTEVSAVPEPGTWALWAAGAPMLFGLGRRRLGRQA